MSRNRQNPSSKTTNEDWPCHSLDEEDQIASLLPFGLH